MDFAKRRLTEWYPTSLGERTRCEPGQSAARWHGEMPTIEIGWGRSG
jgi:hypothetical protein